MIFMWIEGACDLFPQCSPFLGWRHNVKTRGLERAYWSTRRCDNNAAVLEHCDREEGDCGKVHCEVRQFENVNFSGSERRFVSDGLNFES